MTAVVFAVLLFLAVPISLVLALTALWYIYDSGNTVLLDSYLQQLFGAIQSYGLLAIPLFMLAGELMNEGGLTSRLVNLARILVGGFRGGMAYINLVANMMMAAIMGSAASQIAMMSRAMVPAMEKDGYEKPYAAAITAAGGLLSPIIPPSMLFVLFGVLAQVPIADMFIAGIIPGLVMSFLFFIAISLLGLKYQYPKGSWPTRQQAKQYFLMGIPAALIPLIIIGGILTGLATPTESAALASMGALVIGKYVYRDLKYKNLFGVLRRTAFNSGMVIMLIAAAGVFGWVIIFEKIPQSAASWNRRTNHRPFHVSDAGRGYPAAGGHGDRWHCRTDIGRAHPHAHSGSSVRHQRLPVRRGGVPDAGSWLAYATGWCGPLYLFRHDRRIADGYFPGFASVPSGNYSDAGVDQLGRGVGAGVVVGST